MSNKHVTLIKRRVTKALTDEGLVRDEDFRYSDEGKYGHLVADHTRTYNADLLGIYPRIPGGYRKDPAAEKIQTYRIATLLTEAGFNVYVDQCHEGNPGMVVVNATRN